MTSQPEQTPQSPPMEFTVEQSLPLERLDAFLHQRFSEVSRGTIQRLLAEGHIRVDNKVVKPNHRPRAGETISITWPQARPAEAKPEEMPLSILFEDADLLVINKPAGLVCHPTKTDEYSSLISRARLHLGPGSHPQLVNRLDRETSGVTLVAKDLETARELRRIWERRQVEKDYVAIVHGEVREAHGIIDASLGKDEQSRVVIKDCVRADGAAASTGTWKGPT